MSQVHLLTSSCTATLVIVNPLRKMRKTTTIEIDMRVTVGSFETLVEATR